MTDKISEEQLIQWCEASLSEDVMAPPDPTYFDTLLNRTRRRIQKTNKPRIKVWRSLLDLFRFPQAALALPALVLLIIFSSKQIQHRLLINQQEEYISALSRELLAFDDNAHDTLTHYDELNNLNDNQIHHLLATIEKSIEG